MAVERRPQFLSTQPSRNTWLLLSPCEVAGWERVSRGLVFKVTFCYVLFILLEKSYSAQVLYCRGEGRKGRRESVGIFYMFPTVWEVRVLLGSFIRGQPCSEEISPSFLLLVSHTYLVWEWLFSGQGQGVFSVWSPVIPAVYRDCVLQLSSVHSVVELNLTVCPMLG